MTTTAPTRTEQVLVRLTPDESAQLDRLAVKFHVNRAEAMRLALTTAAIIDAADTEKLGGAV